MSKSLVAVVTGVVSLALQPGQPEPAPAPAIETVREIPVDTLRDLAIAVYDARHPVIYFNPGRMQNIGPSLTAFFMAHEYGHIHFHHTRASALGGDPGRRDAELQSRELEADCFAAASLAGSNRAAVNAAVRFFSRQGPLRYDNEHPAGGERAAKILSCLPASNDSLRPARNQPGQARAVRPFGARPVRFTLETAPLATGEPGKNIRFRIGGAEGSFSNMRIPSSVMVRELPAGTYDYEIEVELFFLDDMMQFTPSGTVAGQGTLTVSEGGSFDVRWNPGGGVTVVAAR